jgi:hypothetical protein
MKFTKDANANMTSLQGETMITYSELVAIFGQPDMGPNADADKVTCEWALKFADGTIATIYDWKTGYTPQNAYSWHIGGHSFDAVMRVDEVIQMHRDKLYKMVKENTNA